MHIEVGTRGTVVNVILHNPPKNCEKMFCSCNVSVQIQFFKINLIRFGFVIEIGILTPVVLCWELKCNLQKNVGHLILLGSFTS